MIPHHINAVNMAKILMKLGGSAVGFDETTQRLMCNIVNTQNQQIQAMEAWRDDYSYTDALTCSQVSGARGAGAGSAWLTLLAVSTAMLAAVAF
jgi:hypothetical protein